MRKFIFISVAIIAVWSVIVAIRMRKDSYRLAPPPVLETKDITLSKASPSPEAPPPPSVPEIKDSLDAIRKEMLDQLRNKSNSARPLPLPILKEPMAVSTAPANQTRVPSLSRQESVKKRTIFPLGITLNDAVPVYNSAQGHQKAYELWSGDLVRIYPSTHSSRLHIHPGANVYLAATTKEIQTAGLLLPDQDGWVDPRHIHIFEPNQEKEFLFGVAPITLGSDPSFSMLNFYESAMRNPDPVVHRFIGPRLIALAGLHESYISSWSKLYRDRDPMIRDAALAALRERGVGQSPEVIEDLVKRLIELTRTRAQGETEAETLLILSILKKSAHPRVPIALGGFEEEWKKTQGEKVNKALQEIIHP